MVLVHKTPESIHTLLAEGDLIFLLYSSFLLTAGSH